MDLQTCLNSEYKIKAPSEFKELLNNEFLTKRKQGISASLALKMLIRIRILKYITNDMLDDKFSKIRSVDQLNKFVKLGLLECNNNIYSATDLSRDFFLQLGLNQFYFPPEISSLGEKDCLMNSRAFSKAFDMQHFFALIYQNFENFELRPDGILIRKNNYKYKIDFLEVEKDKGGHESYLLKKQKKYIKLASSDEPYRWWKNLAPKFKLRVPDISEFKFGVIIISNKSFSFGNGFTFVKELI